MLETYDTLPRETRSLCPWCGHTIRARLYEKSGDVWMTRSCPEHGDSDQLFWKNAALYRALKKTTDSDHLPGYPSRFDWKSFAHMATTLAMDPTSRCNFRCPDCFSNAETAEGADPSLHEMLARVPVFNPRRFRPNIALVGGESTLRDDLPELIQGLLRKLCTPRLNTNGLILLDRNRRRRLKEAGLRWVILQFDGFSGEASLKLRGRDLIEQKLRVIELLGREGFSIHLAVMLARGINDGEVGKILEFALNHRHVKRISFYPRSKVGRNEDSGDSLVMHLADVFHAMEIGTEGRVTSEDLLEMKRLWHRLFQITRHPVFRQRICISPLVVVRSSKGYITLNRLLKPEALVKEPKALWHLARSLREVLSFDRAAYSDTILLVNIEKFYHTDAFDLDDAMNCHHIYLTSKGYIPFCLYNSFFRPQA